MRTASCSMNDQHIPAPRFFFFLEESNLLHAVSLPQCKEPSLPTKHFGMRSQRDPDSAVPSGPQTWQTSVSSPSDQGRMLGVRHSTDDPGCNTYRKEGGGNCRAATIPELTKDGTNHDVSLPLAPGPSPIQAESEGTDGVRSPSVESAQTQAMPHLRLVSMYFNALVQCSSELSWILTE